MEEKLYSEENSVSLAHGHRYGLVGYNGSGKTTLLCNIAERQGDFAKIPKHMDTLLVQQEAAATDISALDTVINSDVIRIRLLQEEQDLLTLLETTNDRIRNNRRTSNTFV